MRPSPSSYLMVALLALKFAQPAHSENWPAWRGPRGDGTSLETNVPVRWSATRNVVWKTGIPGNGHASPVVWGNRLFTVSALLDSGDRVLLCLDRTTGK